MQINVSLQIKMMVVASALALSTASAVMAGTDAKDGQDAKSTPNLPKPLTPSLNGAPIYIEVEGRLNQLLLSTDIISLLSLEGCVGGKLPVKAPKPKGVCRDFAQRRYVDRVAGPATFVNQAAIALGRPFDRIRKLERRKEEKAVREAKNLALAEGKTKQQSQAIAKEVRKQIYTEFVRDSLKLSLRYGLRAPPQPADPDFVTRLVFDPDRKAGTPKRRFAALFPDSETALIAVYLKKGLSDRQRLQAAEMVKKAVSEPGQHLKHGRYRLIGELPLARAAKDSLSTWIAALLVFAAIVMAFVLYARHTWWRAR